MIDQDMIVTAPVPPAVTGGGQSPFQKPINNITATQPESNEDFEIEQRMLHYKRISSPDYLHTVSLTELYDTAYIPKVQVVDDLLSSGAYLFAGAPKVGKSFFMAQLSYHVSNGLPLWDYPVHKGTVLYLALEDVHSRLQKRLSRMFGMDSTDDLHFATHAKSLGGGLDGQLEKFVQEHINTKLIIIDTLQKIREVGGENCNYANDYDVVTQIKRFADRHNICVLLVHHTRKQGAEDCFETISGTNGLLGAADGAFIMHKERRTDNKAILDVVGRDQQDQRLHLIFDRERCIWQLTETETELWVNLPDPLLEAVARVVTSAPPEWSGSASELAAILIGFDVQPNVLTRRLNVNADRLWNEHNIRIDTARTHAGRTVKLTLDSSAA